ncbi:GspH/FimT family pseudopilin [Sphaerotilus uruguayifluvii]|uniref:Type II secretion system protein H n=1 Tax=Sphaerotilus uruguayifluvii TaxID=2735897 RepID=A0ABX2G180_9BURK|nr:GspH/FimT family pseudopilin [Leptothrix sp. C29]NRT55179.1 prepilin-type N-terminal cleavage/methylation domain-containing protein [Leptothrix sp. C29]
MNLHVRPARRAVRAAGAGFSAIELMVSITVMAIALTMAVPGMVGFIAAQRAQTLAGDFVTSLGMARSEAIRTGRQVTLEALSGGSSGNEFAAGWALYLDSDGNGVLSAAERAASPNPLRLQAGPPVSLRLRASGGLQRIVVGSDGFLVPPASVTVEACPVAGGATGVRIEVPPSGIADVTRRITCTS